MFNLLKKIFGTKSERDIKAIKPYLEQINIEYNRLQNLSNDEIRILSSKLKEDIANHMAPFYKETADLEKLIEQSTDSIETIHDHKEKAKASVKSADNELEKKLLEILPQAFAIIKDTCRRFTEQDVVRVQANDFDKKLSNEGKQYLKIEGNDAIWATEWDAQGNHVKWNMIPYDVQLIGGIVLHQGKISEMATGEGKTLTSVLPIFLNALAGKGVHVVTVNDYLAKRDSAWHEPIFHFHGLSVDCIDIHNSGSEERKNAYKANITYGTNNEFGFDYLRDNMATDKQEVVQKKLHYAIVDEVDSVLIDDARTPLIISGPVQKSDEQDYADMKPIIEKLVDEQKHIVQQFFQEAKQKIESGNLEEGGLALFRVYRGLPKYKPLIKYLSEKGIRQILYNTENIYLQDNSRLMPEADQPLLFSIEEKNNLVELTEKGLDMISTYNNDPAFFLLPDISILLAEIENDETLSIHEKNTKKEDIAQNFALKAHRVHVLKQLLKAYTLFENNIEYIVKGGKVKIVDEQTGRILDGRRYSDGLHQALEAKENVQIQRASQTYATITLQNYFRMYHKIAGMTGTASTEAGEFWEIYKLDVVEIPTNKPTQRIDKNDFVYKTTREKFNAIIEEINTLVAAERPVLVGTTSVEISELISRMLSLRKIPHQVLNAKYHELEAEIVAKAGIEGTVTIATNMAGRGTDIKLTEKSKQAGGLAIIGTERHESRRVDRQLRGRSGRQGDVGSSQFFLSLEDPLMRLFGSDRMIAFMDKIGLQEGEVIESPMVNKSIESAQQKVEQGNFSTRKRLLEYDNVMNSQRTLIYDKRYNVLFGKYVDSTIKDITYYVIDGVVRENLDQKKENFQIIIQKIVDIFGNKVEDEIKSIQFKNNIEDYIHSLYETIIAKYIDLKHLENKIIEAKSSHSENETNHITVNIQSEYTTKVITPASQEDPAVIATNVLQQFETDIILSNVDEMWRNHLRDMDDLRQSVQNAVYEKQDPLLIYKIESYNLFEIFLTKLYTKILKSLYSANFDVNVNYKPNSNLIAENSNDLNISNEELENLRNAIRDMMKSMHLNNIIDDSANQENDESKN